MKRTGVVLLSGLAVLLLLSIATAEEDKEWNRPVTPVNPIQVDKPKNWTETAQSECPAECTKNGCCTGAFDQLSWMLLTMPKSNCSFCRNLRYTLGALKYDNETEQCRECLVNDFTTMVSNFKCPNDNGKCSKCCMDLTIIYLARFVFSCPDPVWQRMAEFNYKDTGFIYDGASTCPAPKKREGPVDPYDEEYWDSLEPNDPRNKIEYPKRANEAPAGDPGFKSYDYHYTEVHNLGIDFGI